VAGLEDVDLHRNACSCLCAQRTILHALLSTVECLGTCTPCVIGCLLVSRHQEAVSSISSSTFPRCRLQGAQTFELSTSKKRVHSFLTSMSRRQCILQRMWKEHIIGRKDAEGDAGPTSISLAKCLLLIPAYNNIPKIQPLPCFTCPCLVYLSEGSLCNLHLMR
jgi:hypothetical protein